VANSENDIFDMQGRIEKFGRSTSDLEDGAE